MKKISSALFDTDRIAPQPEIDAQRARLAPWLWPVRITMLVCYVLALYVAFYGCKVAVPMVAEYSYGPDWWPKADAPLALLAWIAFAGWFIGAFAVIAFLLLRGVNYVGQTVVLVPYLRTTPLSATDVSEAAHLADSSSAVESYRAAVAQQRGFVVGDLEVMRILAEQDRAEALEKKLQAIQGAAHKRLHGEATCSTSTSQDV